MGFSEDLGLYRISENCLLWAVIVHNALSLPVVFFRSS